MISSADLQCNEQQVRLFVRSEFNECYIFDLGFLRFL